MLFGWALSRWPAACGAAVALDVLRSADDRPVVVVVPEVPRLVGCDGLLASPADRLASRHDARCALAALLVGVVVAALCCCRASVGHGLGSPP